MKTLTTTCRPTTGAANGVVDRSGEVVDFAGRRRAPTAAVDLAIRFANDNDPARAGASVRLVTDGAFE